MLRYFCSFCSILLVAVIAGCAGKGIHVGSTGAPSPQASTSYVGPVEAEGTSTCIMGFKFGSPGDAGIGATGSAATLTVASGQTSGGASGSSSSGGSGGSSLMSSLPVPTPAFLSGCSKWDAKSAAKFKGLESVPNGDIVRINRAEASGKGLSPFYYKSEVSIEGDAYEVQPNP